MTTLLFVLVGVAIYAAGWLALALPLVKALGGNPRCHGECSTGYAWRDRSTCQRYCESGCWRAPETVSAKDAVTASAIAIAWPLAAFPVALYLIANKQSAVADHAVIARLERELGMDR